MPRHVISRLMEELSNRHKKPLKGSRILLSGVAYKKNIDDLRESPSMELWELLELNGAEVDYYDPHISKIPHSHDFPQFEGQKSIHWNVDNLSEYDAVIIATDHTSVDYQTMAEAIPLLIDTRNILNDLDESLRMKVAKA